MPEPTLALLRLSGELSTKARATRRQFVTRLLRNVRDALDESGLPYEIERHYDRILVLAEEPGALEPLERIFGLQSLAPSERLAVDSLAQVVDRGEQIFRDAVRGRRFAVRARTVGSDALPGVRGRDVEVELGARLLPDAGGVDLENPEVTARIELFQGHAYFFRENRAGPGGLPLGSGDRAVALVSGGFDSPVAAWQLLRRGVNLDYVFCNLGGFSHQLGTLRVMQVLANRWSYGTRPRLHAIDFSAVSRELQRASEPRYWQVILKRLMLRAAEAVAEGSHGQAIITGEAVGQVSSQTLVNLRTISEATSLPILRPLIGSNKEEIIRQAEQIGTAPLSAVVDEYCAMVPRKPATAARLAVVAEQEADMDPEILARALANREVLDLRSLDPDACGIPEIETDDIPNGSRVLDLRTRREYEQWHYPGALHLDFGHARDAYASFAKDQPYVLYCEYGLKSAHLAELMRGVGQRAFHFRGGTRALKRWAEEKGVSRQADP
ncbi:MAG: tRNA 4-thiouridine(8) synthase ThiI [Deltaproteobacteria bacterium]|jgi:thiamine biosynthesis protein ThiI|nr:tRNA 4-thiouridine(8) synthase ThiI [Deltaproteobacteria bacterium]